MTFATLDAFGFTPPTFSQTSSYIRDKKPISADSFVWLLKPFECIQMCLNYPNMFTPICNKQHMQSLFVLIDAIDTLQKHPDLKNYW